MRKLLCILLVGLVFSFGGCNNRINKTPNGAEINVYEKMNIPTLKVTFNSEDISVEKGGYSWEKDGESVTVDAESPEQIANKMEGNKIEPESELVLNFSEEPISVNIIDWSELKGNSYSFNNDKIIAPKEEGTYVYEIVSKWSEGQVSFTIKVIVSNE